MKLTIQLQPTRRAGSRRKSKPRPFRVYVQWGLLFLLALKLLAFFY